MEYGVLHGFILGTVVKPRLPTPPSCGPLILVLPHKLHDIVVTFLENPVFH